MRFFSIARGLAVVAILALCWDVCSTQSLHTFDIENLEKLEWLYETGQIDSDEYERYLAYFIDSLGVVPDTLLITTESQMIAQPTQGLLESIDFDYRMYHRATESQPYRELYDVEIQFESGFYIESDLEADSDREIEFRSRTIGWRTDDALVQVGSVDPVFCDGLILGRHPLFLDDKTSHKSAIFPTRSRYNGVLFSGTYNEYALSGVISRDRDESFESDVYGSELEYRFGKQAIAVSFASGELKNHQSNASHKTSMFGLRSEIRIGRNRLDMSGALDSEGDQAYLVVFRDAERQHELSFWSYSEYYDNPFMAARANSDTREVNFEDIDFSIRSRYNDETGMRIRTAFDLPGPFKLTFVSDLWKTSETEKYRVKSTARYKPESAGDFRLTCLIGDDSLSSKTGDLWSLRGAYTLGVATLGKLRLSVYTLNDNRRGMDKQNLTGECNLKFGSENLRSDVTLRYYDPNTEETRDQYLYVSTAQVLNPANGILLSLQLSTRFGPEQETMERTRLKLEARIRI